MVQPPEGPPLVEEPLPIISPVGFLSVLLLIPGIATAVLSGNPLTTVVSQSLKKALPAEIPDPATAVVMRLKAAIDDAGYKEIMLRHGFDENIAVQVLNASETILTPAELVNANFRGIIDDGRYTSEMSRLGFTPESGDDFKETARFVAGPTDLVRFAVREVFTPEIVSQLGLADEFPSEFVEAVSTWGMSEETAENFWKAHWVLPSIQQGFAMLHRRVKKPDGSTFEIEDMNRLLRIQDVMPFFRDMITQIAFQPFTRVDVRRMHKMGVLTREEVKSAYMDRGFDDEKAEAMTEFTIRFNTEGDRDLTKTEILRALDRKVIEEDLAIIILDEIGLSFEAASVIVATHQAKVAMDLTDELSDIELDRFIDGLIAEDELMDALALLDLTAGQLEVLMAKARKRRRRAEKMPSKADILRWHIAGIVDRETADTLLDRIGIREEFRVIYLQESVASAEA
ncbi:hypothetical protein LCGC14_1658640 [marine sediment metagenome]|uniref:Uncharacterized protein n=1 Tax=marine sediment metagenome TaxID=412755 RepID=A0A0F9KAN0_9ZZZZ